MFNRHQILKTHYAKEISQWKWHLITKLAKRQGDSGCFLGSVFNIMPSGKYYMPWTTNQTRHDEIRDGAFWEALETVAAEHGGSIVHGEGDPCDLFFMLETQ